MCWGRGRGAPLCSGTRSRLPPTAFCHVLRPLRSPQHQLHSLGTGEQKPSPGSSGMGWHREGRWPWGKVQASPGSPGKQPAQVRPQSYGGGSSVGQIPQTHLEGRHHGFIQMGGSQTALKGGALVSRWDALFLLSCSRTNLRTARRRAQDPSLLEGWRGPSPEHSPKTDL